MLCRGGASITNERDRHADEQAVAAHRTAEESDTEEGERIAVCRDNGDGANRARKRSETSTQGEIFEGESSQASISTIIRGTYPCATKTATNEAPPVSEL